MREQNGFLTIVMYILLVFLCVALALLMYLNVLANRQANEELAAAQAEKTYNEIVQPTPVATPEPTPEPVRNTTDITLAFGGDMVAQLGITTEAKKAADESVEGEEDSWYYEDDWYYEEESGSDTAETAVYDYTAQLENIAYALEDADITMCTLVGSMMDAAEYESYLLAPSFAEALAQAGFDMVSTASDHCLDFGVEALDATIEAITAQGMVNLGTAASQEDFDFTGGIYTKVINGATFAFLTYTWATNGVSTANEPYAVNILTTDYMTDKLTVDYDRIDSDLARAKDMGADIIVCSIAWSSNDSYYSDVRDGQRAVTDYLCEHGADIIVGSGLKVPQPIELKQVKLDDGSTKNCLIAYSLGNLLNCLNDQNTNLSALLYVTLKRDMDNGEVWLSNVSYRPMFMLDTDDYDDIEEDTAAFKYRLFDLYDTVERFKRVNAGEGEEGESEKLVSDNITRDVYDAMITGAASLQNILGAQYDEKNGGVDVVEWGKEIYTR